MFYYARINENNIVIGVSQHSKDFEQIPTGYISIGKYNDELMFAKYQDELFKKITFSETEIIKDIDTVINLNYEIFNMDLNKFELDGSVNKNIEIFINDVSYGNIDIVNGVGSIILNIGEVKEHKINIDFQEVIVNVS